MANTYAADARSAYADLKADGGPIVFTVQLTAPVPDPVTGTWTPGTTRSLATYALQLEDDPEQLAQLAARGVSVDNPVTVMAASISDTGEAVRPTSGMPFTWGGDQCSVKSAEALDPSGSEPIYWMVIGNRGGSV